MSRTYTRGALVLGALFFLVTGAWALLAPRAFFDVVASYPPYNAHLFHDLGAFSGGIGAALATGLTRRGGAFVALAGGAVAATLHAGAHWADRAPGGRGGDPVLLTVLALALLAGAAVAARDGGKD